MPAARPKRFTHFPVCDLVWSTEPTWLDKSSRVLISTEKPPQSAFVFLHGWGGKAITTWDQCLRFAHEIEQFDRFDIFFCGYETRATSVPFAASSFRLFLEDLLEAPSKTILEPTLQAVGASIPTRTYARVVICAHSMGGAVTRRAVLDLRPEVDVSRVRLLLFAPAHKGAVIERMIVEGLGALQHSPVSIAAAVPHLLKSYYRSLGDLTTGSDFLKELELQTKERFAGCTAPEKHPWTATVLHAEKDKIVEHATFAYDPPMVPVLDKNHRTICKPQDVSDKAIKQIIEIL